MIYYNPFINLAIEKNPNTMPENYLIQNLPSFKGETLDKYLAAGWYRYGAQIFTINSFTESETEYDVYWLRYNVEKITISKSSRELIKKNNHFEVAIRPFVLTREMEDLHNVYFNSIDFITSNTIHSLMEDIDSFIYDSYSIEIRDENKLIAVGIFDEGKNSIAGIKNFYDPEYKKFGLGKLLMLIKYQYCLTQKIQWYYPGYIAPGYRKFDYKLFMDKNATEVFLFEKQQWNSFGLFAKEKNIVNL